ncbi:MAG: metallophosphoesterase [Thermoanaerobaculia bacterium]
MIRPLFFVLLLFALLGDARVFLFVMNRLVFGSHRHEKSELGWLMYAVPPVLLVLTLLFWPLHQWVGWLASQAVVDRVTPEAVERAALSPRLAQLGAAWLIVAASIGLYWIIDRLRALVVRDAPVAGTRSSEPEVVRLRRAHVPFAWLRKLGAHNDVYDIEVTHHEVVVDGLPEAFDGFRIAFLTDTHVASFVRPAFYREAVSQAMRFRPDLVLLGGDFVTWKRHIPLMAEVLLSGLSAPDGVYAVLGNHDYWADANQVRDLMEARGVEFIVNRRVTIDRRGTKLDLIGIDEVYRGEPDLEAAFAGLDGSTPVLGLSHHPDIIDLLEGRRLDLLVCGHTHGGQIRFPFFGSVVVPSRHEARYAAGFRRVGRVLIYVSRGIGAIPPLRILCRPEVATFTLRRA